MEQNKSIYYVGRNEFGFGMLIEGDNTYVADEHDAEKSDLHKFMGECINSCKRHGLSEFNFVAQFGKDGRVMVAHIDQKGVSIVNCDKKGQNIRYTFTKEEASDISKISKLLTTRSDSYMNLQVKGQNKVSFYDVEQRMAIITRCASDLNFQLNLVQQAQKLRMATELPTVRNVREQVALAM